MPPDEPLGYLRDCVSKLPEECELLILPCGMAFEWAMQRRDWMTQALLPVSADCLPKQRSRIDRVLDNSCAQCIIASLGVGIYFKDMKLLDIQKLRYHKIIAVCEDSVEGKHLGSQLAWLFNKVLSPVLTGGHLYQIRVAPMSGMSESQFEDLVLNKATRTTVRIRQA